MSSTYRCPACEKVFDCLQYLRTHLSEHAGELDNQCVVSDTSSICDEKFDWQRNFLSHMTTHTRKNECDFCKKSLITQEELVIHHRSHTDEKRYQCDICSKVFTTKGSLTEHNKVHTGEKGYHCGVCSKEFSHTTHLENHMRIHTGEKPYRCNICEKSFSQTGNQRTHMKQHTG